MQWQHDPEARTFRWLPDGASRFAMLTGEGSVGARFLAFVHSEDRARAEHALVGMAAGPIEYRLVFS